MRILYFNCPSGISGDMTAGSLIDLGVPIPTVLKGIDALGLPGFAINIRKTQKCGISATKFDVIIKNDSNSGINGDLHEHRGISEIKTIIENSALKEKVKDMAMSMFRIVAEAEAKVHNTPVDKVHFHEVGAIDSIVDLVAAAICIDYLAPDRIIFSALREGVGFADCEHGKLPVPVPAVLEILRRYGIAVQISDIPGEMITPTGAAIAAALGDEFNRMPPAGKITCVGYGAGTKDFEHPNLLCSMIFNTGGENDEICVIEAAIDDSTGEELGFAIEMLLEKGAVDAYFTPVYMKKCRPAYLLTVLCKTEYEREIVREIFKNTSTIGLRCEHRSRYIMDREVRDIATCYGNIKVKISKYDGIIKRRTEYESAKAAAVLHGVSVHEVMREAESADIGE